MVQEFIWFYFGLDNGFLVDALRCVWFWFGWFVSISLCVLLEYLLLCLFCGFLCFAARLIVDYGCYVVSFCVFVCVLWLIWLLGFILRLWVVCRRVVVWFDMIGGYCYLFLFKLDFADCFADFCGWCLILLLFLTFDLLRS